MNYIKSVSRNLALIAAIAIIFAVASGCEKGTSPENNQPVIEKKADQPKAAAAVVPAKTEEKAEVNPVPKQPSATANESKKILGRVVFITTSKGCPCTMNRCQSGESALKAALAAFPKAPEMERFDDATDPRSKEYLKKFNAIMLPVVYFLDPDGNLLDKVEGELNFNKEKISEFLDLYDMGG